MANLTAAQLAAWQNPQDAGHRIFNANVGSADSYDPAAYAAAAGNQDNYSYVGTPYQDPASGQTVYDTYNNRGELTGTHAWEKPNTMADLTKAGMAIGAAYLGATGLQALGAGQMGTFSLGGTGAGSELAAFNAAKDSALASQQLGLTAADVAGGVPEAISGLPSAAAPIVPSAPGVTSKLTDLASKYLTPETALKYGPAALAALGVVGATNKPTPTASQPQMSAAQQAYFNKGLPSWDWDALKAAAAREGIPLSSYIARNWNKANSGAFNAAEPVKFAHGGLAAAAGLQAGSSSGRADDIDARLSPGEYVMDAETVSLLGNGNNAAGASQLDHMRSELRKHKGAALAKGKFSADAKSPLAYMKER